MYFNIFFNLIKLAPNSLSKLLKETEKNNKDLFGIEEQFDNWINSNTNYPIIFVYILCLKERAKSSKNLQKPDKN